MYRSEQMEIQLTDETFQFDRVGLLQPNGLSGGSYLTKIQYMKQPLYIQTPKTMSKQGIVISGKKAHIDLLLSNDDAEFLEWMENLETRVIALLFEKRNMWFNTELEMSDIENSFTSPIRPFKGGKSYLVRVNVESCKQPLSGFQCKVFDEHEHAVALEYIKPEHKIISILEVLGVKFTSRSFQLELSLKQSLVLADKPLFDACVIKRKDNVLNVTSVENQKIEAATVAPSRNDSNGSSNDNECKSESNEHELSESSMPAIHVLTEEPLENIMDNFSLGAAVVHETPEMVVLSKNAADAATMVASKKQEVDSLPPPPSPPMPTPSPSEMPPPKIDEPLREVDIHVAETAPITLKRPKDVYYELYRIAKEKAIEAKKRAIEAYLEAKNIKATYMLDDLDDEYFSDDSSDLSE